MLNLRVVIRQLGLVMGVLSASMLVIALWAAVDWAKDSRNELAGMQGMFAGAGVGLIFTLLTWFLGSRGGLQHIGRREALLLVALSWLLGATVASVPFLAWGLINPLQLPDHPFASPVSCLFEAVSGLTTTGATVLTDIEAMPKALLLWRAMTHWLGGMGIVVLVVAVLPNVGAGSKKLFMAEVTGPSKSGLRPRIKEAARVLLWIYIGLNVTQILLLKACGLSLFDSVCEAFATIATGGFSTKNASTAGYHSLPAEIITIVFMLLSGVNFGLYFQLVKGRWRQVGRDPELRFYALLTLIGAALVVGPLIGQRITLATGTQLEPGLGAAVRHGVFNFVSLRTNTGFATADINPWGFLPAAVIMFTMSMGACSGSTAGGIKLVRCLVILKEIVAAIGRSYRPYAIKPVRLGKTVVDDNTRMECITYAVVYLLVLLLGGAAVHLLEARPDVNVVTALSASAACLSNSGPGLGLVGTVQNYGWMTDASKIVLCVVMLLGRLEMYAIFVLFLRSFWRGE